MSGFDDLVEAITSRAVLLQEPDDRRKDLGTLFLGALRRGVREVHAGCSQEDFKDLVVLNLILMGVDEGYSTEEMHQFIHQLRRDT